MSSIREQIIAAIIARMAIIREANGFNSDCGENVFRARKRIDATDLDAVSVFPRREGRGAEYGADILTMPVDVQLIMAVPVVSSESEAARSTRVSQLIEKMLADAIEAMTGYRWTLPFTSGSREPVPGDTIEGATSEATGLVESVTLTGGTWAGGNAAGTIKIRRRVGTFASEVLNIGAFLDVCTIPGTITADTCITLATGGLADSVIYTGGGVDEYPDPGDATVGVVASFEVAYPVKAGNPYAQP